MKKTLLLLSLISLLFFSETALCQEIIDTPITNFILPPGMIKTFPVNGRVLGLNLEVLPGVIITDTRTKEKTATDSRGTFRLTAAKADTFIFEFANHSKETRVAKSGKDNMNVIMIKRKVDELPANPQPSDLRKAERADEELYNILEKDAKIEGKWKY
jgi:hypothetical protein